MKDINRYLKSNFLNKISRTLIIITLQSHITLKISPQGYVKNKATEAHHFSYEFKHQGTIPVGRAPVKTVQIACFIFLLD